MRHSRKAGLLNRGVMWIKHECDIYTEIDGYEVHQYAWKTIESGTNESIRRTGYSLLPRIVWSAYYGRYIYDQQGEQRDISVHEPGTIYICIDPETVQMITVNTSGSYSIKEQEISTTPRYRDAYDIFQAIGSVRASDGEYPDAKNGYTYVTIYDGYTIMNDNGDYYAYKEADKE